MLLMSAASKLLLINELSSGHLLEKSKFILVNFPLNHMVISFESLEIKCVEHSGMIPYLETSNEKKGSDTLSSQVQIKRVLLAVAQMSSQHSCMLIEHVYVTGLTGKCFIQNGIRKSSDWKKKKKTKMMMMMMMMNQASLHFKEGV